MTRKLFYFLLFLIILFVGTIFAVTSFSQVNVKYNPKGIATINKPVLAEDSFIANSLSNDDASTRTNENYTINNKYSRAKIPTKIIKSSDNFINSFVDGNYSNTNFRFIGGFVVNDSSNPNIKYLLRYNLEVESTRENQKTTFSSYMIKVFLDKDGNIISGDKSKEKYSYIKKEEISK